MGSNLEVASRQMYDRWIKVFIRYKMGCGMLGTIIGTILQSNGKVRSSRGGYLSVVVVSDDKVESSVKNR